MSYQAKYQAFRALLTSRHLISNEAADNLIATFSFEAGTIQLELEQNLIVPKIAFLRLLNTANKYLINYHQKLALITSQNGQHVIPDIRESYLANVINGNLGVIPGSNEHIVSPIEGIYSQLFLNATKVLTANELREANSQLHQGEDENSIERAIENLRIAIYAKSRLAATPKEMVDRCDQMLVQSFHPEQTPGSDRSFCAPLSIHDYLFHRMNGQNISLFNLLTDLRDNRTSDAQRILLDGRKATVRPENNEGERAILDYVNRFIESANTLSQSEGYEAYKPRLEKLVKDVTELDKTVRSLQIDKHILSKPRYHGQDGSNRVDYVNKARNDFDARCQKIDALVTEINNSLEVLDRAPAFNKFQVTDFIALGFIAVSLLLLIAVSAVCAPVLPIAASVTAALGAGTVGWIGMNGIAAGMTGMVSGVMIGLFGRKPNPLRNATEQIVDYGNAKKTETAAVIHADDPAPRR